MPGDRRLIRTSVWLSLAAIGVLALVVVFVLPWFVPIASSAVVSDAQAAGFSNKIAIVGLVLACVVMGAVACAARRLNVVVGTQPVMERTAVPPADRVDRGLIIAVAATVGLTIAVVANISNNAPWGDASYFMNAILRTAAGGHPYSEIAFAYGPLLLYGPLITWRVLRFVGVGPYTTYYAWVAACHAIGLLLAVYVLNRLRMSRRARNWAFVLLGLFDLLQFHLGPNYTWFRFLFAYALLLWVGTRLTGKPTALELYLAPSLAVLLVASVSPEMAVALLVALVCILAFQIKKAPRTAMPALIVLGLAGAIGVAVMPRGSVGAFTTGALNFPVFPGLPQIAFLVAMLFLAFGVGSLSRRLSDPAVALSAGWSVLALVLIAPAFGRADFGHIFWNGVGAFLLCIAVADSRWHKGSLYVRATGSVFLLAAAIYAATCFTAIFDIHVKSGVFSQEGAIFAAKLAGRSASSGQRLWLQAETSRATPEECAELSRLPELGFTEPLSGDLGLRLAESGNLVPLYANPTECIDLKGFTLAMTQLSRAKTIAVPAVLFDRYVRSADATSAMADVCVMSKPSEILNREMNGALFWFPIRVRARNPVFDPTASFAEVLETDWQQVGRTDHYVLLEKSAMRPSQWAAALPIPIGAPGN